MNVSLGTRGHWSDKKVTENKSSMTVRGWLGGIHNIQSVEGKEAALTSDKEASNEVTIRSKSVDIYHSTE